MFHAVYPQKMLLQFKLKRLEHSFPSQFKEELNEILGKFRYLLIVRT